MGEQFGRYIEALTTQVIDRVGNIGRIPVDDGSYDEVQAGCPELLGIQPAVSDPPLLERPDHLRKGVALLALG